MTGKKAQLLAQLKARLADGEEAMHCVIGSRNEEYFPARLGRSLIFWLLENSKKGIFVATPGRMIYFAKTITGFEFKDFPYKDISSLETSKKLMGHKVEVVSFGNKVYLKWIKDKELEAFLQYAKARVGETENRG